MEDNSSIATHKEVTPIPTEIPTIHLRSPPEFQFANEGADDLKHTLSVFDPTCSPTDIQKETM